MTETLTLAIGWQNLATLLIAAGYSGRFLVDAITFNNRSGAVVTVRRHTSATVAPGSVSGMTMATATIYRMGGDTLRKPIDVRRIWINAVGVGAIDVDGIEVG